MISYLYEIVLNMKIKNQIAWKLFYKINKVIINIFYPISQIYNHSYGLDLESDIIISMTSFPDRIHAVWITILSLLNQKTKPKKILLWLAENQFPDKKIPKKLEYLKKRGLEIQFCDDLKPHKKYYYTMMQNPQDIVITVDDDIFYPENFITNLAISHKKYPDCVICNWSSIIAFNQRGIYQKKSDWKIGNLEEPSHLLLPIGCCGILYPPGTFNKEVFNKRNIYELAYYTDDLWLKCMELLNGTKAFNQNPVQLIYFNNIRIQHSGLWKKNCGEDGRDNINWEKLMNEYTQARETLQSCSKNTIFL